MIISASTSLTTWLEGIALLPNETLPQQSQNRPDNTWNMFLARVNGFYISIYSAYTSNSCSLLKLGADSTSKCSAHARTGAVRTPPTPHTHTPSPQAVQVQIWGGFHYTQQNMVWFREEGSWLHVIYMCFVSQVRRMMNGWGLQPL